MDAYMYLDVSILLFGIFYAINGLNAHMEHNENNRL